jgi:DNA-binding transcriptional regulator GbsR (MarR family)
MSNRIKARELNGIVYYQIPKWLMNLFIDGKISSGAFKTYALMYERLRMSAKNNWIDNDGDVYIKYSYDELIEDLKCNSRTTVSNNLKELQELDIVDKVKCFSSSNIYYLKVKSTEDCTSTNNYTSTETCTSTEKCTDSSTENLYASKNNFKKNNDSKNDVPLNEESVNRAKNLVELQNIATNSTGLNKIQVDGVIKPCIYKDIDLTILIQKIKESDFLMGKCINKPTIAHFTQLSMLNKILADYYKNKVSVTEQSTSKDPSRKRLW